MDNEVLVKSIRNLCKRNDISVSLLENELGFGAGLVSRWVKSSPSLDKIVSIADYFNIPIDEVIGRNMSNENDDFLALLIDATKNNDLIWNAYKSSQDEIIKKYEGIEQMNFQNVGDYIVFCDNHTELSYYTKFNTGYISIYCLYAGQKVTSPDDILLFIQPTDKGQLISQDYNKKELLPLWLRVLETLGDCKPDEIKAADLKNSFIELHKQKMNKKIMQSKSEKLSLGIINEAETEAIQKNVESPEFRKYKELSNGKNLQKTIQALNIAKNELKNQTTTLKGE